MIMSNELQIILVLFGVGIGGGFLIYKAIDYLATETLRDLFR